MGSTGYLRTGVCLKQQGVMTLVDAAAPELSTLATRMEGCGGPGFEWSKG